MASFKENYLNNLSKNLNWYKNLSPKKRTLFFVFASVLGGLYLFVAFNGKSLKPNACDCIDVLDIPTHKVGIGMPMPDEHLSNEEFRKYEACYDEYAGPSTARMNCEGK